MRAKSPPATPPTHTHKKTNQRKTLGAIVEEWRSRSRVLHLHIFHTFL